MTPPHDGRAELGPAELAQLQLALLLELRDFCARHGLRMYLWSGTLLGAVRHRGFIPWDDDVDVAMPRPDHDRLLALAGRLAAETGNTVRTSQGADDDYPYPYAKYTAAGTLLLENHELAVPLGVHVDIFPLDGLPRGTVARTVRRRVALALQHLFAVKAAVPGKRRSALAGGYLRVAAAVLRPLRTGRLVALAERWARRTPYAGAEEVCLVAWGTREVLRATDVDPAGEVVFEGHRVGAPADPAAVLTAIYGDFRQLPPLTARVSHHDFRAYRLPPGGAR